jgi:ribose 1,5-bisphosphokinase PhnN
MKTSENETLMERLTDLIPRSYRQAVSRFAREAADRFPPVVIQHRIEALERHLDRRLRELEGKIDELLRRNGSKAA